MKRCSLEVKLFALEKRKAGREWEDIRQAINDKFDIEPPTTRTMQRWEQQFANREGLTDVLTEEANKMAEVAKTEALTQVAGGLLSTLWVAKDTDEDVESAGWKWFFSIVEKMLGSEKFRRFLKEYLTERKGKPDLPAVPFTNLEERSKENEGTHS